ncbi:hypothetical protein ABW21_db0201500 [Orbilia brochopaga]|nr:hypothetical protein ABW21_db0201500 [Drechslerella brochopaga]
MRKKRKSLSEEVRKNISKAATGRVLSDEAKEKISKARTGIVLSVETRTKISKAIAEIQGVKVTVTNIQTGENKQYSTMTEAAKALNVSRTAVKKVIESGKLLKKIYNITIVS